MQTIVGPSVSEYLYQLLPERDPVLAKMEEVATTRNIPIVGPLVGRLFYQLAVLHKPKRIYEMGSAIGYSTLWWAKALSKGDEVHYTDGSKENANEAEGYLRQGEVLDRVRMHVGNALHVIDSLSGEFDIIFCDIDKGDYPMAFKKALPRLRRGGLLIADNVLWSGRVAEPSPDAWTAAIKEFNQLLYSTPGLFTTIVPLRDGVSISLKL